MSRVLFVVPPLTGHVNPTVAVALALRELGHEVAWCGHPSRVAALLPADATLLPLPDLVWEDGVQAADTGANLRGLAALKFLWEDFLVPMADVTVPQVEAHVDAWRPDLLVVDQQMMAGGLVARRRGLPWATLVSTSAGVTDEIGTLPKVEAWRDALFDALQLRHGLEPVHRPDLSPHRVVVLSTPALVGRDDFPAHYRLTGPSFSTLRRDVPFPWDRLDGRPLVVVSLGSVNADMGRRFYAAVAEGLGPEVQVALGAPADLVPDLPDHVLRQDWLPLLPLIARASVVVCHAGHNTVCEALAHGVPLVTAPIRDDQPVIARQVEEAGAGLRLRFGRVTAARLGEAVTRVRTEPSFAEAARRIQASFASAGGPSAAARAILEVGP